MDLFVSEKESIWNVSIFEQKRLFLFFWILFENSKNLQSFSSCGWPGPTVLSSLSSETDSADSTPMLNTKKKQKREQKRSNTLGRRPKYHTGNKGLHSLRTRQNTFKFQIFWFQKFFSRNFIACTARRLSCLHCNKNKHSCEEFSKNMKTLSKAFFWTFQKDQKILSTFWGPSNDGKF